MADEFRDFECGPPNMNDGGEIPVSSTLPLLERLGRSFAEHRHSAVNRNRLHAPRLNPFDYLEPDEVRLSQIMADLLSPDGTHGQGDLYLREFLRLVGFGDLIGTATVSVTREHAITNLRRIDILIRGDGWVVAIENKPWAIDQPGQVRDYLSWLRNQRYPRAHLLYLTRSDTDGPTAASISKRERDAAIATGLLRLITYRQIAEWLENSCVQCGADRARWFTTCFADHVRQSLLGALPREEEKMLLDTLLDPSNRALLPAALELLQAREAIREELERKLESDTRAALPPNWTIYGVDFKQRRLGLKKSDVRGWHFGMEEQRGRWFYGIKCDDDLNDDKRRALKERGSSLAKKLEWSAKSTDWWPLWRWFDGHSVHGPAEYQDWGGSIVPWLHTADGTMARNLVELAKEMFTFGEAL